MASQEAHPEIDTGRPPDEWGAGEPYSTQGEMATGGPGSPPCERGGIDLGSPRRERGGGDSVISSGEKDGVDPGSSPGESGVIE